MKKLLRVILALTMLASLLVGCRQQQTKSEYTKYTDTFFDAFDTVTTVVGYTKSEQEFKDYFAKVQARFMELHRYYDIYNNYDGVNNIKTINDNAGIKPVKVSKEIIDLIQFAKDWDKRSGNTTNIAMGSVLKIWHDYREVGKNDPDAAELPPLARLQKASQHTDINKVVVDTSNSTVYLADPEMSLDVGAVAKGYATEIVAQEIKAAGLQSGIISAGGNVRVLGKPLDGVRERWGIGVQDPSKALYSESGDELLDTLFLNDESVVSSGDYERYYIVNGQRYHHLIDPKTLMPGEYYSAVTVITQDSGDADALSTAVFLLPYEQSSALVKSLKGVEAIWVFRDGRIEATDGAKKIMKSHGATGAKAQ
ncbi:MAG: FAD:protein FMN transferase [Bacillota bacterium]